MRNISWQAFNMHTALMASNAQHQPAGINLIMRTALMAALCATSAGKHLHICNVLSIDGSINMHDDHYFITV